MPKYVSISSMPSPLTSTRSSKGHHGFAHLQGAEHRVDAVCFSGQGDVVAHCRNLRVGGVLLEVPHRDAHALGDLHQPIGQSRYFFLGQNALADKDAYPYFVDNEAELFAPESGKRASPPS